MKNRLSRSEITGLILLGGVIVGITLCGILLKDCQRHPAGDTPAPVVETVVTDSVKAGEKESARSKEKSGSKRAGKQKEKKKRSAPAPRDPFSDTIATY